MKKYIFKVDQDLNDFQQSATLMSVNVKQTAKWTDLHALKQTIEAQKIIGESSILKIGREMGFQGD